MKKELIKKITTSPLYVKYQIYIIPGISALIAVAILIIIIIPQILSSLSVNEEISAIESKKTQYEEKANILKNVNVDEYQNYNNIITQALPPEQDLSGAVDQISQLAVQSGLKLDGISFGQPQKEGDLDVFFIKVDASGQVDNLKRFVNGLDNLPRLTKADSLEINNVEQGGRILISINTLNFFKSSGLVKAGADQKATLLSLNDKALIDKIKGVLPASPPSYVPTLKGQSDPFE
jgi:type IV pilus assembly protein PilO